MSIFKRKVVTLEKEAESSKKVISIADYYGNIEIDLLDVDDKVIEYNDVNPSDFALMFTNYIAGLLTKTQYSEDNVGIIVEKGRFIEQNGIRKYPTFVSHHCLLAPVLKFERPLKEIFKNIQKDEMGRDIVYFSKYPIEAIGDEEKNAIVSGEVTNLKIHFDTNSVFGRTIDSYPVVSYNNEEYIKAISRVTSSEVLRNKKQVSFNADYVIKLKPIKWLCDYENNRLVCLDGLIAGIPYNRINENFNFKETTVYDFLKNYLLPDIMQFVEVPKLEEVKNEEVKSNDIEIKDNILNMLRDLLNKTIHIKDESDKILIVEDIRMLANIYGTELIKIKNKDASIYGSTERELIRNGILPYYVYIEGEINREVNEDNKEKENKEIEIVINKLKERANLINDDVVKNDVLLQIEELNQEYLNELFKGKTSYQRIDFNKPLVEVKTSSGEVKLTFVPPRPVLIKELVEKEIAISKRIDREINNNALRDDLGKFDNFVTNIVKR